TILKILATEGDTIAVGAVLAEIDTGGSDNGRSDGAAAAVVEPPAPSEPSQGRTVDIVTPTGGESVTEGTILEWSVKVGDAVKDGDTVVEISTDKVDMELPAPATGTITEILFEEGATVTVGQVIARMTAGAATAAPAPAAATPPIGDQAG